MDWRDIDGWFDYASIYYEQIQRARDGARFVEVGSWLGKSAAYMGKHIKLSGKKIAFTCVDNFVGGTDGPDNGYASRSRISESFRPAFEANLRACGVDDVVTVLESDSVQAARWFDDNTLDFVWIDADHGAEAVYRDLCAWWPKVKPGGLLAGHDWNEPGPKEGATRFAIDNRLPIYGDGAHTPSGYRSFGIPKPRTEPVCIMLVLPTYNAQYEGETLERAYCANYSGPGQVLVVRNSSSALGNNFNNLWCTALNDRTVTHFAMVHSDVLPQPFWLNVLMHELDATGAQMVSAVIPLKDQFGITSTAIGNPFDRWRPWKRFSMTEIMNMPATFDVEQAGFKGMDLLLNTGCWMCDLRDPRWRATRRGDDGRDEAVCYFTLRDRIINVEGKWIPNGEPEDFFFSRQAQKIGLKLMATRKVQVGHAGRSVYPNEGPWGVWKADEATRPFWGKEDVSLATPSHEGERTLMAASPTEV